MSAEGYISVPGWRRFQHYDPEKRIPPWIKVYTELGADDAFQNLSAHARGILVSLWIAYAAARCQLRGDTATLSRRLGVRVTARDLETLNHAGFIDLVASKTLADGYQGASNPASKTLASRARGRSLEEETEREEPLRGLLSPTSSATREEGENSQNGRPPEDDEIYNQPPTCACFAPPPHDEDCPFATATPRPQAEDIPF